MNPIAKLALEDGTVFTGTSFGATGEVDGEVCFNTSMTGYQEILTDPSYRGQIVTMTYPQIGNCGVNSEDVENRQPFLAGFVVRESSRVKSNFRAAGELDEYLRQFNIVGLAGIDTRRLVRILRTQGAMKGVLSSVDLDDAALIAKAKSSPGLVGRDLVSEVLPHDRCEWDEKLSDWHEFAPHRQACQWRNQTCCRSRLWHEVEHRPAPHQSRLSGDRSARHRQRRRCAGIES